MKRSGRFDAPAAPPLEVLAAYMEGEVTASEAAAIEAQLAESAVARRQLDRLRTMRDALAGPIPERRLEETDLCPAIGRALRAPAPAPRRRVPFWAGFVAAGALAGAVAVVAVTLRPRSDEFRVKSAASANPDRWVGLQIYRVGPSGSPERLGDHLSARDGLVFSYTNLGPLPFGFVMIFAVDAGGQVRWFYPAYEIPGTNPAAVAIRAGGVEVALGEVIHHDFAPGPLAIYALFTRRALNVLDVESVAGGAHGAPERLPFADTAQQRLTTRIDP